MKTFFRKMDEMEMAINLKSLRLTHIFTILYLLIYLITLFISSGFDSYAILKSWAFLLLIMQSSVHLLSQQIMKIKLSGSKIDEE